MGLHQLKNGLDLPISGSPVQLVEKGNAVSRVALVAQDYVGMKPRFVVDEGAEVKRGQKLFEDRKVPGVWFTAPAAGTLTDIHRGEKRALQSVVIKTTASEAAGNPEAADFQSFEAYTGKDIGQLDANQVRGLLVESGAWTAFRTRPFSRTPSPEGDAPHSIFVEATDSRPLAPVPDLALKGRERDFAAGLQVLAKLTSKVFVCVRQGSSIPVPSEAPFQREEFGGPHPSGMVGTHIHFLDGVGRNKTVWHLNYQDVAMFGVLFREGVLDTQRVVALGGPTVKSPRLVKTRIGASLDELMAGEVAEDATSRVVSGSVLGGRTASGDVHGFLGRFHLQTTALEEGNVREFLGWLTAGANRFSVLPIYISRLLSGKLFNFTTNTNGSPRAMVPIGMYEKVMPLDVIPTYLLRALVSGDLERAEQLGCLELDEEDLALCTFVCPGKYEYGPHLRRALTQIQQEG